MFRNTKQLFIVTVYVVLFTFLSYGIWSAFLKPAETCLDGIRNQNEEQIDCGGVCGACQEKPQVVDMQVQESNIISGGQGSYDVFAKIYNPNDRYGASTFSYTFVLKDGTGSVVTQKSGISFILPKETKYIMHANVPSGGLVSSVEVKIENPEWQLFSGYREKPALNVYSKRFGPVSSGTGFGEAFGIISNESSFDFQTVTVKVLLRDDLGKPLALNITELNDVINGQRREFHLIWPTPFPGNVGKVEVETEADVYHSDNFVQQYFPAGDFQQF